MRSTSSLSLTALAITAALGLCLGGCSNGEQAASTYHPAPAAWYGSETTSATGNGDHAAQSTSMPGEGVALPGTTRATANFGGTGGGPSNGAEVTKGHRGHVDGTTGIAEDGAKPVSRTGK